MRQKLFKKYFLATAITILVSLTVMMMILTFFYNRYLAAEKYSALNKTCNSITDFVNTAVDDNRISSPDRGLYYIMNNLSRVSEQNIMITDNSGVVKSCICHSKKSGEICAHIGKKINTQTLDLVLTKGQGIMSDLGLYETSHYVFSSPLTYKGIKRGYVIATAPAIAVKELTKSVAKLYVFSAVVPLVLMFFALYAMNYKMTKPLKLMSEASRAMARGDFSKRIPVTTDDEIGQLAVSFNQMTEALVRLEETRKDFIANISHELKTPMTSIGGFIDGINDGTVPKEKQEYYLKLVSNEIHRLSRMVEEMLNVSQLESREFRLKPTDFDFSELVLNVVLGQEKRIEEKNFSVVGLDNLPPVTINADKDLIYRVIYNLVDNAIKFTNVGGTIKFSLKIESKQISFSVENTGEGISEKDLPFVFERFYKGDKSRSEVKSSTGLGLYIVKRIVKNHNGTINVSSVKNNITCFKITLPKGRP